MPPIARLPTVRFQSLLLPPIRIRLRSLQTLAQPQCAPAALRRAPRVATCYIQRRPLHLYKTARAVTALGMHKVLDFDRLEVKPPSESTHRVNLVKYRPGKEHIVIEKDLSLQELYDKHIEPGKLLYLADDVSKKLEGNYEQIRDTNVPAEVRNYAIGEPHGVKISVKGAQPNGKQLNGLKNIIMLISNPIAYRKLVLDRAYQFIEIGSPVEFRIRLFGSGKAVKARGKPPPSPEALPWLFDRFPHMRPDFILKSMPEGTEYLIRPVTDGRMVQFVVGKRAEQMPKLELEKRLYRVKAAVAESLPNNAMALRHNFRRVKKLGDRMVDGGIIRKMSDEEIELQKQIRDTAGTKANMNFREKSQEEGNGHGAEEHADTKDNEETRGSGWRLDSVGARQPKWSVHNVRDKRGDQKPRWGARGVRKKDFANEYW